MARSFRMSRFRTRSLLVTPLIFLSTLISKTLSFTLVFFLQCPSFWVVENNWLDQDLVQEYFRCFAYILCVPYFTKVSDNVCRLPAANPILRAASLSQFDSWEMTPPKYIKSSHCTNSLFPNMFFISCLSLSIYCTSVFVLLTLNPNLSLVVHTLFTNIAGASSH